MSHTVAQDSTLQRWAFANALAVGAGVALAVRVEAIAPLLPAGVAPLVWLIVRFRGAWTPGGRFGTANSLTVFRIALTAALPFLFAGLGGPAVIVAGTGLLLLDLLDGQIARRRGEVSAFGEYLDKETDALMVLVLCLMLFLSGRLGAWILLPGGLRYLFVVVTYFGRPEVVKERRERLARYVYALTVVALLAAFLPFPALYMPLALGATLLLTLSFARSFWLFFTSA